MTPDPTDGMSLDQASLYESVQPLMVSLIQGALAMYERDKTDEMRQHALLLALASERIRAHCGLEARETRQ